MPLSEDEQRILSEIEQQLYETDPALAHEVGSTTVYTDAFRKIKWATVGFVAGLALMIVLLISINYWAAFAGFLVMLASALYFERNARKLGRAGLQQMTQSMRAGGLRDYFSNAGQRARDKFKRGDEE